MLYLRVLFYIFTPYSRFFPFSYVTLDKWEPETHCQIAAENLPEVCPTLLTKNLSKLKTIPRLAAGIEEVSPHVIMFFTPLAQLLYVVSMQEELARLRNSHILNSPNTVPTPTWLWKITVLTDNSGHLVCVFSPTLRHVCCYTTPQARVTMTVCAHIETYLFLQHYHSSMSAPIISTRECQNTTLAPLPVCQHRRTQKIPQTFYFTKTPNLLWIRDRELERGILASQLLVDRGEGLQLVLHISAILGIKVHL